jgi:hypothetical protein
MIGATGTTAVGQSADQKVKEQYLFKINAEAGVVIGSNANAGKGFIAAGWQKHKYFAGASVGLDTYFQSSIPILLQGRYLIADGRNPIHLVMNGGINPAIGNNSNNNYTNKLSSYLSGGVQIFFSEKKQSAFMSLYYAQKQIRRNVSHNIYSPVEQAVVTQIRKENYLLRGVQVGLGWQF